MYVFFNEKRLKPRIENHLPIAGGTSITFTELLPSIVTLELIPEITGEEQCETDETVFASYEVPNFNQESTMDDPTPIIPAINSEEEELTFTVIDDSTQHGKKTVIDSKGFLYTV
jgi:hypothetical protein